VEIIRVVLAVPCFKAIIVVVCAVRRVGTVEILRVDVCAVPCIPALLIVSGAVRRVGTEDILRVCFAVPSIPASLIFR